VSTQASTAWILIVEDDSDFRDTLTDLLQIEGYRVTQASNGREALAQLRKRTPPCIILLDLMMPEMNGWQFREEQLKDDRLREIPVVVMTASRGLEGDPLSARQVLYKPIGLGELISAVERHAAR
jgi:CheY-like chemotaxis protein